MSYRIAALTYLLALALLPSANADDWSVDYETGYAWSTYNTFRVPNDTGTTVSLNQGFDVSPELITRIRLTYHANDRESWSLLYAPLTFRATGSAATDISFNGLDFPANTPLSATYEFNSYRLTYRRMFHPERRFSWGLGLTAKIRDASIALSDGTRTTESTNLGFVPLVNFRVNWNLGDRWDLLLDGDALVGPQGRAEDVLLALKYRVSDSTHVRLGYRVVEGGADVGQVYSFARVDYATIGLERTF